MLHDLVKKSYCDYCGQYCEISDCDIINKWWHDESTCLVIKENAHRLLIIKKIKISTQTYKLKNVYSTVVKNNNILVSIQFKKLYGTNIVVNSITDALLIFIFYT